MNLISEFEASARFAAEWPQEFIGDLHFLFLMNSIQIAALFTDGDDFRILGHLNEVYRRALDEDVDEAISIVSSLTDYYLDEGCRGRLTLEEAHAGLGFRSDSRLWERFLEKGCDGDFVRTRIQDATEADAEVANFNRLKAGLDRRAGRLDDAERALQALHEVLARDPSGKGKLAFVEYELGYVNFLQADVDLAVSYFHDSYVNALAGNDPVGAWIGKCLEYRTRWLFGRSSCDATLAVFRAARERFSAYSIASTKKLAAKRWMMNAVLHQIEVSFVTGDAASARSLLEECKVPPVSEGVPPLEGILDHYEGLVALMENSQASVRWLEAVVDRKARSTALAEWYNLEAGAMDFYYLGIAYKRFGEIPKAKDAWTKGKAFPASMGNQIWRARCESELEVLSL
jgi:tetratricopeptide (TPR) repeat protein